MASLPFSPFDRQDMLNRRDPGDHMKSNLEDLQLGCPQLETNGDDEMKGSDTRGKTELSFPNACFPAVIWKPVHTFFCIQTDRLIAK